MSAAQFFPGAGALSADGTRWQGPPKWWRGGGGAQCRRDLVAGTSRVVAE